MAANVSTSAGSLPPLPEYQLHRTPSLLPYLDDKTLSLVAPVVAYWVVSLFWHIVDELDLFPQYRLHTPAEILKRNHAGRWEVARDVIIQQIIQTLTGYLFNLSEPDEYYGREEYDVAAWAQRLRIAQRAIPGVLGLVGVDALGLSKQYAASHPSVAGALAGGIYPELSITTIGGAIPQFAGWELAAASAIYWYLIPALQFLGAVCIVDTWQYFLHRAMHMNKWLYTTFHSRHHRLYVPYAYGALYNHPFEGFLLDTLGAAIAYKATGMNVRQAACFFTGSTIKTVDDHCGYHLPWDPLQLVTSNNAGYHDVHHQSWGVKTNFSQPFFTFWDRLLGTKWQGGDVSARYERARIAAQQKVDADNRNAQVTKSLAKDSKVGDDGPYKGEVAKATMLNSLPSNLKQPTVPSGKAAQQAAGSREQVLEDPNPGAGGVQVLREEAAEEMKENRRSARHRAASSLASDGIKGLRERVSSHGRTGGVLGVDH